MIDDNTLLYRIAMTLEAILVTQKQMLLVEATRGIAVNEILKRDPSLITPAEKAKSK